jgi:cytoskeletal protein CcmA (bactofilin family)
MSDDQTTVGELFLGEGVTVNGFAIVPGKAILNGQFDGALTAKEIEIQSNGIVNGTIQAEVITVDGQLNKSIQATDILAIGSSGVVKGDISYGKLVVTKGAELEGVMKRI